MARLKLDGHWMCCMISWVCCAMALTGCSSNQRGPISTSLTGLTSESRSYRGLVVDQVELISIAGLLGTPAPGLMYHLIDKTEQQSLIGVSYDTKSFVLVGESVPAGAEAAQIVTELKTQLERRDQLQSLLLEEIASLRGLELKWVALAAPGGAVVDSRTSKAGDPLDRLPSNLREAAIADTTAEIRQSKARLQTLRAELQGNSEKIRSLSSHEGVIVAKWERNSAGSLNVEAVPFAGFKGSSEFAGGGYIILGGVRVLVPFFSMDATSMFLDIEEASPGSIASLPLAGVTTYLLQSKEIAYTNSTASQKYAGLRASINATALTGTASLLSDLQLVTLDTAFTDSQHNASGGRIGNFTWRRVDLNFSDRWTAAPGARPAHEARELRCKAQNNLLTLGGVTLGAEPTADGGWTTVIAQIMSPGRASRLLLGMTEPNPPGDVTRLEREVTGGRPPALLREP